MLSGNTLGKGRKSDVMGALIWVQTGVPFDTSEIITDKEGRWVVVLGKLNGQEITLASIYAPNQGQLEFLRTLSVTLSEVNKDRMIIGEDFNSGLDVELDRSTPPLADAPIHKITRGVVE